MTQMTLNEANNAGLIKVKDIIQITSEDKDIICRVIKVDATGITSTDICILRGKRSLGKQGQRGFYKVMDTHYYKSVDINEYPEYQL